MRKSNIGIDLDGVICDLYSATRPLFKELHGVEVTDEVYDIEKEMGLTKKQVAEVFIEAGNRGIYREAKVYTQTRSALVNISRQYNIFYVTVRDFYPQIRKDTFYWLDKNKLPYFRVAFSRSKYKIAEKEDFQFFLDDSVDICNRIAKTQTPTYLFRQPWNNRFINHRCLDPLVKVVSDWREIEKILLVER